MKGFVFTLSPRKRGRSRKNIRSFSDVSGFLKRYGAVILFTLMFAVGMVMGSVSATGADASILHSLDFLFNTNLEARLSQPMYLTFVSSFASNFIFLLFVFMCGLSCWGMAVSAVAPLLKGFGTGLCAGYLFITYGFKGVGFYLLAMLLGTFLFTFSLIIECAEAYSLSCKIAVRLFSKKQGIELINVYIRSFLLHSLYMLLLAFGASFTDMLLWKAFSGLFF
ncbi:MAG: hypothetical protein ACI4GZ_04940 [Ruminococcus sp.]